MRFALTVVAVTCAACAAPAQQSTGPAETDIFVASLFAMGEMVSIGDLVNITDRSGYDNQPAFTPDGEAILYASQRGGQTDIYRYRFADGTTEQVTRTLQQEYSPTPMPEDDGFSVIRVELDDKQRVWRFDPSGRRPQPLLDWGWEKTAGYHAWAGADTLAVFVTGDPSLLELVDLAGGQSEIIAENVGRTLRPVPGKQALSFSQQIDDDWWVMELNLASGAVRRLVEVPTQDYTWSPSGMLLTATGNRLRYWIEGSTRDWVDLGELPVFPGSDSAISRLAVSPGGNRIALVASRPR